MLYDIYLSKGCRYLPNIEDLTQNIPLLADLTLQEKFLISRPGFLGLDLQKDLAKKIFVRLRVAKAGGQVIPSAYRMPKISEEQASIIVKPAIKEKQEKCYAQHKIVGIYLKGYHPRCWVFDTALEPELKIEGAGVATGVDKLDGHIWEQEDFISMEKEQESIDEEVRREQLRSH